MRSTQRKAQQRPQDGKGYTFSFSHTAVALAHEIGEEPQETTQWSTPQSLAENIATTAQSSTIPIAIFANEASTMQAVTRYLVDSKRLSYTTVAKMLGRSPKSVWASYHQTRPLPKIDEEKETIHVPLSTFSGTRPPLEALVLYLRTIGLRNIDIARALKLDPRTVWTTAKRAEVRS